MVCVAPTCHKTRVKKVKNKRPVPGRCMKPNAWMMYRAQMSGLGLSREEISSGYLEVKQEWLQHNAGLTRRQREDKMNTEMCRTIANSKRKCRKIASSTRKNKRNEAKKKAKEKFKSTAARNKKADDDKKQKEAEKKIQEAATKKKQEKEAFKKKECAEKNKRKKEAERRAKAATSKKELIAALKRSRRERKNELEEKARGKKKESERKAKAATSKKDLIAALKRSRRERKNELEGKAKAKSRKELMAARERKSELEKKAAKEAKKKEEKKAKAAKNKKELIAALKRSRRERQKFFAKTDVPAGWSTEQAVAETTYPYKVTSRDANYKTETISYTKKVGGLREDEVESLLPGEWYFDEVIKLYMNLLQNSRRKTPKSVFLQTVFYNDLMRPMPGRRRSFSERHRTEAAHWTKDIDTTHPDATIFIPVNVNRNHWILLVVDNREKKVFSLDSLRSQRLAQRTNIMKWVEHEHIAKNVNFDKKKWSSEAVEVPSQDNGYDCGPFVCLFAAFLSHGQELNFTQADLPKLRERLNWSILNAKLEID